MSSVVKKSRAERVVEEVVARKTVSQEDYDKFWEGLCDPGIAAEFAEHLIRFVASHEKKESGKDGRSGLMRRGKSVALDITKDTHLSTLYFVTLFLKMDLSDPKLRNSVLRLEQDCNSNRKDQEVLEVCAMLKQRSQGNEGACVVADNIVINMLQHCSGLKRETPLTRISGITSLMIPFLRLSLTQGRYASTVIKTLDGLLKLNRMLTEDQLVLLLFLLRMTLLVVPCRPAVSVEAITQSLRAYTMRPEPYSTLVRQLVFVLQAEAAAPGYLRRAMLHSALKPVDEEDGDTEVSPNHFVFHDVSLRKILPPTTPVTAKQLQLTIMLDWVRSVVEVEMTHDFEKLPAATVAQCFGLYQEATRGMTRRSGDQPARVLTRDVHSVWEKLRKAPLLDPPKKKPSPHDSLVLDGQFGRVSLRNIDFESPGRPLTTMPHFETVPALSFPIDMSIGDTVTDGPAQSSDTPSVVPTLPRPNCTDQLLVAIQKIQKSQRGSGKICVCGDDKVVAMVIRGYTWLKTNQPNLFEGIRVFLLVVPTPAPANCHLATFLAKQDVLYRESVFSLGRCQSSFLPCTPSDGIPVKPLQHIDDIVSQADREDSDQPIIAPSPQLLRQRELQMYLWTARHITPLYVFKCECFRDTSNTSDVITIPMSHFLEISTRVEALNLKEKGGSRQVSEPDLTVRFQQMNPQAHASRNRVEVTAPYSTLYLSNIPLQETPDAQPSSPSLNLYGQEPDKSKKKGMTRSSVVEYGEKISGPMNHHVSEVEIRVIHKVVLFHVCIDGVVSGPFHRIKVSAFRAQEEDEHLSIPLVSYLPTSL